MLIVAFILNAILCSAFASHCDTFIISNAIIVAAILIQPTRPVPRAPKHRHRNNDT